MNRMTKQKRNLIHKRRAEEFYKKMAENPPKTRIESFKEMLGHEIPPCLYCRTYSFAISQCNSPDHEKEREPRRLCASHLLIGEGQCRINLNTNVWSGHQVAWGNLFEKKEETIIEVTPRQRGRKKRRKKR